MRAFTVHSAARQADAASPEDVTFVPDGYSFAAFAFGIFWLVYRRLWLALALALILFALVAGLAYGLDLHPGAVWGLNILFNLFLGHEGNQIWRRSLEQSGRPALALVCAQSLRDAEVRYFTGIAPRSSAVPRAEARTDAVLPAQPQAVLGLFPQPGGRA